MMPAVTRKTVLGDLIQAREWLIGAELGVWKGELLEYLLDRFPRLFMVAVDHWRQEGAYVGKDMELAETLAMQVYRRYRPQCNMMKMSTDQASKIVAHGALDFAFIDASHDTASVLRDIENWRPKIRAGGALTGHDANWPSVSDALAQALPGWQRLEANCWLFDIPGGTDGNR